MITISRGCYTRLVYAKNTSFFIEDKIRFFAIRTTSIMQTQFQLLLILADIFNLCLKFMDILNILKYHI